ncbi:MAG: mechanosensitive ion channel [Cyclobacteriaceae bacterium]|nr:mechanosensitive ion channel [Cyclobacteriaceae bacterium]
MEWFEIFKSALWSILEVVRELFTRTLFQLGEKDITLGGIFYFFIAILLLIWLTDRVQKLVVKRVLVRSKIDIGVSESIGTIFRYLVITIGLFVIIQTAGIDLTALGFIAGALGVGIGFGLQGITNNFISGLIILFERPIKVGDRIDVGDISGDVVKIAARATTVVTNDNISIIIPNSEFINSRVINWSHNDRRIRFNYMVGVSYNEDPRRVRKLLLEVAKENNAVLKHPPPDILFKEYADSAIVFNLRVWTYEYTDRPNVLKSQLYYAIFKKFRDNNVSIPFPQRDLHIKSDLRDWKEVVSDDPLSE